MSSVCLVFPWDMLWVMNRQLVTLNSLVMVQKSLCLMKFVAREFPHTSDYLDETVALLEKEIPWMQCMLSLTPASKYFPQKPILLCVRSKSVLHGISVFQVQRI